MNSSSLGARFVSGPHIPADCSAEQRFNDWLAELESCPLAEDLHSDAGTVIRRTRWDYDKQVKIPQSLVEEISRTTTLGQQQSRGDYDDRMGCRDG